MATRKSQVQEKRSRSKTPDQKRARNRAKTEREKRREDAKREELQRKAREVLGSYPNHVLTIKEIERALPLAMRSNIRKLGVALRRDPLVARVMDYGEWAYALRTSAEDAAPISPTLPSPRPVTMLPPPGAARDLAERQAMYPAPRERIQRILGDASLPAAQFGRAGLALRVTDEGQVLLRWATLTPTGEPVSCAWTEEAEQALERGAAELQRAGYKATIAPGSTPAGVERGPTEAAEEVARLKDKVETLLSLTESQRKMIARLIEERDDARELCDSIKRDLTTASGRAQLFLDRLNGLLDAIARGTVRA